MTFLCYIEKKEKLHFSNLNLQIRTSRVATLSHTNFCLIRKPSGLFDFSDLVWCYAVALLSPRRRRRGSHSVIFSTVAHVYIGVVDEERVVGDLVHHFSIQRAYGHTAYSYTQI